MGDAAKYFKYDAAGAKALLAPPASRTASTPAPPVPRDRLRQAVRRLAEAKAQFLAAIGVKATTDVQDYTSKYITQTFAGNFKGIAFGYETPFPEAGSYLTRFFTDNPQNHGKINDPELTTLATKQQSS